MSSSDHQENTLEGRYPVDAKDRKIQEVAAWAVAEYNSIHRKHGKHLVYVKTLKEEEERKFGGTRYFIDLEAADDCMIINKYYAQVLENQAHTRKLEEFKQQGYAPIRPVAN